MKKAVNESLLKVAVLGAQRSRLEQSDWPSGLTDLGQRLIHERADRATWFAIGAGDVWTRAGHAPIEIEPGSLAPAVRNAAPLASQNLLSLYLHLDRVDSVRNWLQLAAKHGHELAAPHLVDMLELGVRRSELRTAIGSVLGGRGHWLVAQHARWGKVFIAPSEHDIDQHWQFGTLEQRQAAFSSMRADDAARARALLQAEWRQADADTRIRLLPEMKTGLCMEDEPFLESALDDKRKEVRQHAQELLLRLPDSRLRMRHHQWLAHLGNGEHFGIATALPESDQKAMQRDGLGTRSYPLMGAKASLLRDVVARASVDQLVDLWRLPASSLIETCLAHDEKRALVGGVLAACAHSGAQHSEHLDKVLLSLGREDVEDRIAKLGLDLHDALLTAPASVLEALMTCWFDPAQWFSAQGRKAGHTARVMELAMKRSLIWSERWSASFVAGCQSAMQTAPEQAWLAPHMLKPAAWTLSLNPAQRYDQGWPSADWPHWTHWRETIDSFLETITERERLQASFSERSAG